MLDGKHAAPQTTIAIAIAATMSKGVAERSLRVFIVLYFGCEPVVDVIPPRNGEGRG
jgi:hypothetical protein